MNKNIGYDSNLFEFIKKLNMFNNLLLNLYYNYYSLPSKIRYILNPLIGNTTWMKKKDGEDDLDFSKIKEWLSNLNTGYSYKYLYYFNEYIEISHVDHKERLKKMFKLLNELKELSNRLFDSFNKIDFDISDKYPFTVNMKLFKLYFEKWINKLIKEVSLLAMKDELNKVFKEINEILKYDDFIKYINNI